MSDIQNQNPEEIVETPTAEVTPDGALEAVSVESKTSSEKTARPPQSGRTWGDRPRGNRRDGGMREEEKEFKEEMLSIDRVTRVTAWGRQIRFRASIVIGDGKGRVGLGIGKSGEVQGAIEKAIRDAKKNLITFPIVNGTIPHDISVNFKSSSLYIHPAHPGTGIIAWGAVRKIFSVSGIKDVIAKQHGAPNKITNARVTIKALASLKPAHLMTSFSTKKTGETPVAKEEKTPIAKTPVAKVPAAPAVKEEKAPVVKTPVAKTEAKKAPAKKKAE